MTASECWALRCSLLHAGTDDISADQAHEVLNKFKFTTMSMHRIRISINSQSALTLNVEKFCEEVCCAVDSWYAPLVGDPRVEAMVTKMIKIEDMSFSPIPGAQLG